jgi:hypothetical protein
MPTPQSTAVDRLRAALFLRPIKPEDQVEGQPPYAVDDNAYVEVASDDILEVCRLVPATDNSERFADIRLGSANAPGLDVNLSTANVHWLLSFVPPPVAPQAVVAEAATDEPLED